MFHPLAGRTLTRRPPFLIIFCCLLGLFTLAAGSLNLLQPAAHASGGAGQPTGPALSYGTAASSPGTVSFLSGGYGVSETAGSATITLTRSGGTDNRVAARVTVTEHRRLARRDI